jgi:molybdopterin molybdotransferase
MLTVPEALRLVLEQSSPLRKQRIEIGRALGTVLAEDVTSDVDSPPFDKALVDGYAVRSEDFRGPGPVALRVVEEIMAGQTPTEEVRPGEAASIMTGAPLPPGADAVVMHEVTTTDGHTVLIPGPIAAGLNRLELGREMRRGEVVFRRGEVLNVASLGVLATLGRREVWVHSRPSATFIPTGNELVEIDQTPGPGQIRNSNATTLGALLGFTGAWVFTDAIARDHPEVLRERFESVLLGEERAPDVLVVSGGVSAGKLDLVPGALEAVGVRPIFHKVAVRPGKPLWFGVGPAWPSRNRTLVFGLPGNPVSGMVSILLFGLPALAALAGRPPAGPKMRRLPLAAPYRHRGPRATYHPARLAGDPASPGVDPLPWAGSPDMLTVARSNGFAAFPAGDRDYEAGEPVDFLPLAPYWD